MDAYTRKALAEIRRWKTPPPSVWRKVGKIFNAPLEFAGAIVTKTPLLGTVVEKTVSGIVGLLNDSMSKTVRIDAILSEYALPDGSTPTHAEQIGVVSLQTIDTTIGYLSAKYKALAAAEGAVTGAVGGPGIPIDLIALIALNLRAIGEYATYCGFDITQQSERLFALHILSLGCTTTDQVSKSVTMQELAKLATQVAQKKTWEQLEKSLYVTTLRRLSEALGIRLTKAKLAQVIPAAGAIVGAGYNSYYTARVCEAAYFLYRERVIERLHSGDEAARHNDQTS